MVRSLGRRWCVIALAVGVTTGCYTYAPAPAAPAPGSILLVQLNDKGRVGMGDSIGSGARVIEGSSVMTTDTAIGLKVSRISYMSGMANTWSGERLVVPRMFVENVQQRTFSKGRTWLMGAAVTGAVAAFIASRGILGSGSSSKDPNGGPPIQN